MSMVIRKRQLLMATLVVALGAAVFVNWYYTRAESVPEDVAAAVSDSQAQRDANLGDSLYVQGSTAVENEKESKKSGESTSETVTETATETNVATAGSVADYFAAARLNRTKAHDEILDAIKDIIDEDDATAEQKSKANVYLGDFQESVKLEADIENLIKAKTGSECLVSLNNSKAVIVIEPGVLDSSVSLQISDIVKQQAEINSENISITEAK